MFAKTNSLKGLKDALSALTTAPLSCSFPAPEHSKFSNNVQQLNKVPRHSQN